MQLLLLICWLLFHTVGILRSISTFHHVGNHFSTQLHGWMVRLKLYNSQTCFEPSKRSISSKRSNPVVGNSYSSPWLRFMHKLGPSWRNDEPLFLLKLTSTLCSLEIPSLWFPRFSALSDSLAEPTQTSFSPLAGFPFPVRKLHMCGSGLWIAQLLFFQRGERFKWNSPILDMWPAKNWECIKSHVNKALSGESARRFGRATSASCTSAGRVNIVSTVSDWGKEETEPSLWAATRIILVVECTQNQFQHAFTLYNHSCLTASMLTNNECQDEHVVNHDLWSVPQA